jgi:hypothetical protein
MSRCAQAAALGVGSRGGPAPTWSRPAEPPVLPWRGPKLSQAHLLQHEPDREPIRRFVVAAATAAVGAAAAGGRRQRGLLGHTAPQPCVLPVDPACSRHGSHGAAWQRKQCY